MKQKKSHVNINVGLLVLLLSLTVAGTLNRSVEPQYKPETPKTNLIKTKEFKNEINNNY